MSRIYKLDGKTAGALAVSGTTEVHVREEDGHYEARVGFALMGMTNMDEEGFEACDHNPFHEEFLDNFAVGEGETEEEALQTLVRSIKQTSDFFFDF